ncbi:MAG: LicD family protein [Lachnospiraceae bacterium]|nr:LicD family protein [Lachnospiraceae bacterium]
MDAYNAMIKQLESGNVNEHFIEYAGLVYHRALAEKEDDRNKMAEEIHTALCQGMNDKLGLAFPVYSYILHLDAKAVYMENFLKIIRSLQREGQMGWQNAYYLFQQLNLFRLRHISCDTEAVRDLLMELIQHALANCMLQLNIKEYPVPFEKRNSEHIVVLTEELSETNADWMNAVLKCCYLLQHTLGKKVLLVNTGEASSRAGELNYFAPEYGEENLAWLQKTKLEWEGEAFEYLQCSAVLSSVTELETAVKKILAYRPGTALHLGDNSFVAAVLDQWIPVMCMAKTYGAAVVSGSEFQVAFDSREEAEQEFTGVLENHQQLIQDERNLKMRLVFPADYFQEEDVKIQYYAPGDSGEYELQESFHIEKMMKRAWAASIKILKEIECICKRHQIAYFADWGTLLGAVRHQGFVPWDDDIDIAIKREDYNRFLAIARKELPKSYCIVDAAYDEEWTNLYARVLNVEDSVNAHIQLQPEKLEEFYGCPYVVGIDIEPLDYIPRNSEEADLQVDILKNVYSAAYTLLHNGGQVTEAVEKALKIIEQVCNYHFTEETTMIHQLFRLASAISQMYGKEDGDEITYLYSHAKRRTYKFKEEWYKESVKLPFETTTIDVPKEYVKALTVTYGDEWNVCYMGASAHEYPFYRSQQEQLEKLGIVLD